MDKKLTVAIVGLGSRGKDTYAPTAKLFADKMEIVAIADIVPEKVDAVAAEYGIPKERCYESAEAMLEENRLADIMFICTQDRQHVPHALPALKKGYHLLLEKPISPDLEECQEILRVANANNRRVVVCHVLRYTPFYTKLKSILESGTIGDIVSVQGIENVGYWHQAHSFVRGNWRDANETSPMILAKCCHDMDMLLWLTGKKCKTVSSFGSTFLFKAEKAPNGCTKRCLDGCLVKDTCPYDAEKIYITNTDTGIASGHTGWPCNILALNPTVENITEALKEGPYGRCVYHCDNNVVDHQVLNMELEDGATINFTMCAFTHSISRYTRIMGTHGDIIADMNTNTIDVSTFGQSHEIIDVNKLAKDFSGHGGGDNRMIEEFLDMLLKGTEPTGAMTSLERSVESHYVALAAEASRLEGGKPIAIDSMR
ncbi:MAG: Gfo/Idh/MocA family protein [Cellulosilyticaceae bacterium]